MTASDYLCCAYAPCGQRFVPSRGKSKYHSRSCASSDRRVALRVAGAKGGRAAGAVRRQAFIARAHARLVTETKVQAYKRGRREGWKAGYAVAVRSLIRREPGIVSWLRRVSVHDLEAWAQRGAMEMAS